MSFFDILLVTNKLQLCKALLCHTMPCCERNLINQIFGGDSVQSTTFLWESSSGTLLFCSMTHYDITIGNDVARDVYCEIIMGHGIVMGTYYDVAMHTDFAATLIYYVLLRPIMIFLFS